MIDEELNAIEGVNELGIIGPDRLAQLLGIPRSAVLRYARQKRIPRVTITAKCFYFRIKDLQAFFDTQSVAFFNRRKAAAEEKCKSEMVS